MQVHIHNSWSSPLSVAVMYRDPGGCGEYGGWATKGWWNLDPGAEEYVIDTNNRYFYVYAEARDGRIWTGGFGEMYVYDTAFASCWKIGSTAARGKVGLAQVHAAENTSSYTLNLT